MNQKINLVTFKEILFKERHLQVIHKKIKLYYLGLNN